MSSVAIVKMDDAASLKFARQRGGPHSGQGLGAAIFSVIDYQRLAPIFLEDELSVGQRDQKSAIDSLLLNDAALGILHAHATAVVTPQDSAIRQTEFFVVGKLVNTQTTTVGDSVGIVYDLDQAQGTHKGGLEAGTDGAVAPPTQALLAIPQVGAPQRPAHAGVAPAMSAELL